MTFFIQIFGLILNLYLVFLFTSRIASSSLELNPSSSASNIDSLKSRNNKFWLSNIHNDQNRLELLNRVALLLLFSYFVTELDFFFVTYDINLLEFSLIDGVLRITNTKSLINLGVLTIAMVL
jgi:hypothetical protein